MKDDMHNDKPLFVQMAEYIEDAIILGGFPEETQIPSTTELSVKYNINPATALKGINILVDRGIVYKKRGIGMFVSKGAIGALIEQRRNKFINQYIPEMMKEARNLGIPSEEIKKIIEASYDKKGETKR